MTKHMASKWFRSKQFCIAEITAVYALLNYINSVLNCLGKGLGEHRSQASRKQYSLQE